MVAQENESPEKTESLDELRPLTSKKLSELTPSAVAVMGVEEARKTIMCLIMNLNEA